MKNIMYILVIIGMVLLFSNCTKDTQRDINEQHVSVNTVNYDNIIPSNIDARIEFYYNEMLSKQGGKSIFRKIWKWLVAHSGATMFGDCGLNLSCGSCPGLCPLAIKGNTFTAVSKDYLLSEQDYIEGKRVLEAALFNDSIMAITFKMEDVVYNDTLFIFDDIYMGQEVSSVFEKSEIISKTGAYPVSYSRSYNGTTLVDVISD